MTITCLVMFKQLCFTMIKPTLPTHPCNLVDFPHSGCSNVCEEKMNWNLNFGGELDKTSERATRLLFLYN